MNPMEQRTERLFRAIGGVGADLIDTAQRKRFPPGLRQRLLSAAACLALLASVAALVLPVLRETPRTAELSQTMPQQEDLPASRSRLRWSDRAVQQKQRLVLYDTIYYAEAVYEKENAAPGEWVGTVDGMNAYAGGTTWKADRHGRQLPLELLVERRDGYLYCLTYYAWDGPAYPLERAQALEDLSVFALGVSFDDPAVLTGEELETLLLEFLALERRAGRRTVDLDQYLWYDETEAAYVIPVHDAADVLDRWLTGWSWPELDEHAALVLDTLDPPEREGETFAAAVFDQDVLLLTTDRRIYTIRFTDGGCRYEQACSR